MFPYFEICYVTRLWLAIARKFLLSLACHKQFISKVQFYPLVATRGKQKFVNTTSQDNNLKAANIVVESDGELARRRVGEALDHVVDSPVVVLRLDERGHVVNVLPRQVGVPEDAKNRIPPLLPFFKFSLANGHSRTCPHPCTRAQCCRRGHLTGAALRIRL